MFILQEVTDTLETIVAATSQAAADSAGSSWWMALIAVPLLYLAIARFIPQWNLPTFWKGK